MSVISPINGVKGGAILPLCVELLGTGIGGTWSQPGFIAVRHFIRTPPPDILVGDIGVFTLPASQLVSYLLVLPVIAGASGRSLYWHWPGLACLLMPERAPKYFARFVVSSAMSTSTIRPRAARILVFC